MADRWMDDRDRQMRDRDWRRSEGFAHGAEGGDTERRSWQGRDYRGVSPAMRQNEYEADRRRPAPRRRGGAAFDEPGYGDDLRSGDYLGRSDDYESGYYDRSQPTPDREQTGGEHRESFMYRAGERVASWLGLDQEGKPRTHRGRGPAGYKRSDERISDDVHDRLTEDHYLDASAITVAVSGGEVTLSGSVETREDKHRAERLTERVSGVGHVQNNLRLATGASRDAVTARGGVLDAQAHGDMPDGPDRKHS